MPLNCPLCKKADRQKLARIDKKTYWKCPECHLIALSSEHLLTPEDERSRYLLHQNHSHDPEYRNFLGRLTAHLIPKIRPGSSGLDYGSGPGPTLSVMMGELGYPMKIYDPYFFPNERALLQPYDFVTCTETVEHFYRPGKEFQKLDRLIKPGGWLGVMTEILHCDDQFPGWHYHRDPTHVCFYKRETLDWISKAFRWRVEYPQKNVVLFQKED